MAHFQRQALGAIATLLLAGTVQAQSAHTLIGRIGATQINPNVSSGDLTPPAFAGTQVDVKADTQPTAGLTWMWNDHIALDLPLAAGFTHEISGAGAIAGVGKIGEVKALPITLLAQYRFMDAKSQIRPYVGIGPTYAKFYKARGTAALSGMTGGSATNPTTLSVDSKLTFSAQIGAAVALTDKLGLDFTVLTTPLKTRTTLSTGQTIDTTLNPTTFSLSLSMRF